jgi:hypothetical protein
MNPEQLVIFDYSGTLSREAVLFARPEYLMKHLMESGLFDLGVDSLDFFWQEIVNATWEEGSTTGIGYAGLIEKRLRELSPPRGSKASPSDSATAASRFVDSYFTHSPPDRRWQPLLTNLVSHPRICVIVATDHYAEATGYIINFLEDLAIPAKPARELFTQPTCDVVVVANSADMGHLKADRRFWEILKSNLALKDIRRVLTIDDFGHNEGEGDDYGNITKVEARKEKTVAILTEVFPGEITALPFLIRRDKSDTPSPDRDEQAYGDLIETTIKHVENWLTKAP